MQAKKEKEKKGQLNAISMNLSVRKNKHQHISIHPYEKKG